jgi:hypothetical protein
MAIQAALLLFTKQIKLLTNKRIKFNKPKV